MNFFESQDIAKRKTGRLIFLFALAVISLIAITNILVIAIFGLIPLDSVSVNSVSVRNPAAGYDWRMFVLVSFAVLAVIVLGSLYKLAALAGGGARVAEMLNGRLLLPETENFNERQLLNIVEEMALACGTPVPPVYLLEESGINAFAAGYSPGDAIIGVTRGTVEDLNRDELQGVIAHEFSHILHGDMRINIRLIAILHGILVLGLIGYYLMRGGTYSRRSRNGSGIVLLGLGLLVLGYVGTFFGNLIKAAVSRQREFLADASAVQFTRNPHGIGGALMRIATHQQRSYLNNPNSVEISHALFEEGSFSRLRRLYATHPPIDVRIKAILPDWDGVYDLDRLVNQERRDAEQASGSGAADAQSRAARMTQLAALALADAIVEQIGKPGVEQLDEAKRLLREIPDGLLEAAHSPSAARALVYLMIVDGNEVIRDSQLNYLETSAEQGIAAELNRLLGEFSEIPTQFRLPLLSIGLHSLRQLSSQQYERFSANLLHLIKLDKRVSLFEWALLKIVGNTLDPVFRKKSARSIGRRELKDSLPELECLLSMLAYSDLESELEPAQAFARAREKLLPLQLDLWEKGRLDFASLDRALDRLGELKPLQKPAVLKACVACIMADTRAAPIEIELLRAIGGSLDCPIPPLPLH
ncbi:MAG: M48 family metalloprotease [Gammaproteobacteria bacterium]|nr:M48 family metallopeptidase [Pseudomonadales bacterium]